MDAACVTVAITACVALVPLQVDVDELPTTAEECHVSSMPTFQVFHRGVKLGETCGASKSSLEALVRRYCV